MLERKARKKDSWGIPNITSQMYYLFKIKTV